MGLKINKPQPSGIIATYWNILGCDFSVDRNVNAANIELRGYIDKKKRDDGFSHVVIEKIHVTGIKKFFEKSYDTPYQAFYDLVKQNKEWEFAEDD